MWGIRLLRRFNTLEPRISALNSEGYDELLDSGDRVARNDALFCGVDLFFKRVYLSEGVMRENKRFIQQMQADLVAMLVSSFFVLILMVVEML